MADESFNIGIGPRTEEEVKYLLSRGLLVEENGEYRDMSTIIDDSAEESFYAQQTYQLPLVGIENFSTISSEDFNNDLCDDKENVQPRLPSDNSYNEQIEKNLVQGSSSSTKNIIENSSTPRTYVQSSTPKTFVQNATPKTFVQNATPKTFIQNATPKTFVENATPKTFVQNSTPKTFVQNATPKTFVQNATPKTFVQNTTPKTFVQNTTPKMSVQNTTPKMSVQSSSTTRTYVLRSSVKNHKLEESKDTVQVNQSILEGPTAEVQVDEGILEGPTDEAQVDQGILERSTTEVQVDGGILEGPTDEVQVEQGILEEPTNEVQVDQGILEEPTNEVQVEQGILEEPTNEVQVDQGILEEPTNEVQVDEGILEEPTNEVQVDEGILEEPTNEVQVDEGILEEPTTEVQVDEGILVEPTDEAKVEQGMLEGHINAVKVGLDEQGILKVNLEFKVSSMSISGLKIVPDSYANEESYLANTRGEFEGEHETVEDYIDIIPATQEENVEFQESFMCTSGVNNRSFTISVNDSDAYEKSHLSGIGYGVEGEQQIVEDYIDLIPALQDENVDFEDTSLSTSGVNNRSFTISIHDSDAYEKSHLTAIGDGVEDGQEIVEDYIDVIPATQEENVEFLESSMSTSGVNKRNITVSVNDSDSDAYEKSYLGKTGSSGDLDDTMTAIEKLLALADEEEESELNALEEQKADFETLAAICATGGGNSSDLIDLEQVYPNVDIEPKCVMETPVEPFCRENVKASSTGSRHMETPKSRENKSGNKKSENLMYFTPTPVLVPKRILDLKKKGKFFSPSPPRPLPNAVPPRGIRPVTEVVQDENMLTPAKHCQRILKCASSDKKKKNPSMNYLYADVNSPVKEYIYGRATPASILKGKLINSNNIRSLPVPQQKPGHGFRVSGISSITRIPKPKSSISSTRSKLSIGRTSVSANRTGGDQLDNNSVQSSQVTGIPKPLVMSHNKLSKAYEGSVKQRVHNEYDDSLSASVICESALALRHTGLRNESGNASFLQANALKRQFYPGTPPMKPISTSVGKK